MTSVAQTSLPFTIAQQSLENAVFFAAQIAYNSTRADSLSKAHF
jgi:hypothetical protein